MQLRKSYDKSYIFHKPIPLLNIDRYWENFYRSYAKNILWGVKNWFPTFFPLQSSAHCILKVRFKWVPVRANKHSHDAFCDFFLSGSPRRVRALKTCRFPKWFRGTLLRDMTDSRGWSRFRYLNLSRARGIKEEWCHADACYPRLFLILHKTL